MSTLRSIIITAAEEICQFNAKLTFGRLGPEGLKSSSLEEDIGNQAKLVFEETNEFRTATSLTAMLDGAIDMLVVEVWYDVLETAYHIHGRTIEESIQIVLDKYKREPIKLRCLEPMIWLGRLGIDVERAVYLVLEDNNTKFITEVRECASTVEHHRTTRNVDCEARPVDHFQREWGVFRLPDLKMLKPLGYSMKAAEGLGLNLEQCIPQHLRKTVVWGEASVIGEHPVRTPMTGSID